MHCALLLVLQVRCMQHQQQAGLASAYRHHCTAVWGRHVCALQALGLAWVAMVAWVLMRAGSAGVMAGRGCSLLQGRDIGAS